MELVQATLNELPDLIPLVRAYHAFEGIEDTPDRVRAALEPLLREGAGYGRVWLIREQGEIVGYAALCFGYTIEMGGRDAFLDELFVSEQWRGRGIGAAVLDRVAELAAGMDIRALHLEVARANDRARHLYASRGFESREKYHLMTLTFDAGR